MNPFNNIRKPFKYIYFHFTEILIGINFLFFFIQKLVPDFTYYCSLNTVNIVSRKWIWEFVTYMFIHGDISHILSNMIGLLFFGLSLERAIGSKEFILFYFTAGILSGILSFAVYFFTSQYNVFLMGASGAVYAVLLMFAVAFPRAKIYFWGVLPIPAPLMVLIYVAIEVYSQFFSKSSNIAHLTHLFGFGIAWLYCIIRFGESPWKVWKRNYHS